MRQLAAAPGNDLTASHPNSNWVFRGYSPGEHIHGSSLRSRLKSVFSTRATRLGTLHELTKLGPVPIIADALGYHPVDDRTPRDRLRQRVLPIRRGQA